MRMETHYEVLGVSKTAKDSEIKRAYRRAALKNHPDVNSDPGAEKTFRNICEAYEVLSDPERRAQYDRKLNMGFGSAYSGTSSSYSQKSRTSSSYYDPERAERRRKWEEANPTSDKIDDSFGAIFSDLFGKVASSGTGGLLEDLLTFLESQADGVASETTLEFEELLASNNAKEIKLEMENAELLLTQLKAKQTEIKRNLAIAEAAVLDFKAKNKVISDISLLDQEMELIDKVAGLTAREKEIKGHIGRAESRYNRLRKRYDQLESFGASSAYSGSNNFENSYTAGNQRTTSSQSTSRSSNSDSVAEELKNMKKNRGASTSSQGAYKKSAQNPYQRKHPYSDSVSEELAQLKKKLGKK